MAGMSSLYIGVSGLQSSQAAINTTAHNLANVDTKGYVRQQVVFGDKKYETLSVGALYYNQAGHGVSLIDVRHIRDALLDKAYRQENGREAFYDSQAQVIEEIEGYFGELEGERFEDYLTNLWSAVQEVSKSPLSNETRAALVQSAVSFVSKANSIYSDLRNYQKTLNTQVINTVNRVNEIGEQITALNQTIFKIEAGGLETASDYRDQRDVLLDELSGLMSISYTEISGGIVTVKAEGVDFITERGYNEMGLKNPDGESDPELVVPVWGYLNDKEVFNITATVSTLKDNDIGQLKAYILARGSSTANHTDIPKAEDFVGEKESVEYQRLINSGGYFETEGMTIDEIQQKEKSTGQKGITYADYDGGKNSKAYKEAMNYYDKYVTPSSIMTVMAELDQLVNGVVEGINDLLSPTKKLEAGDLPAQNVELYDENGNKVNAGDILKVGTVVMDTEKAPYGKDDDKTQGTELFSRNKTDRYEKYYTYKQDANGNYIDANGTPTTDPKQYVVDQTYYVYNYKNDFGTESLYTLGNISVNVDILTNNQLLPLGMIDGSENRELVDELNAIWETANLKLLPEYSATKNFTDYYAEMIGQIGNAGKLYNNMISQQEELLDGVDGERSRIMDVSSDEELQNLIKYQSAYNASSRFITVIDEMLEHLVTQL